MIRINIFYNQGTKNGKPYKVAHTIDFGYDLSVTFQKGVEQKIQWDDVVKTYFIIYDPSKAGLKIQPNGYAQLVIGL